MKKLNFKKIVAAFLATVMLLAMLPVGAIVATAATANTDYVLGNNTITIMTVEGWNYVATNQTTYAAYNIVLGNNIDFLGTAPSPLFSSVTFTGTFDGNGKTIYGNKGTGRANIVNTTTALIAATINGATIKNVTIDGFGIKPTADANAYSVVAAEATGNDVTFTNIALNNCYVEATNLTASKAVGFILGKSTENVTATGITITKTNTYHGNVGYQIHVGGVVGYIKADGLNTFSNINIYDGFAVNVHGNIGGIVGRSEGTEYFHVENIRIMSDGLKNRANAGGSNCVAGVLGSKVNGSKAAGDSYVKNAYIDIDIYAGDKSSWCGGVIGRWYNSTEPSADLTIENCYITGEFSAAYNGSFVDTVGGVVGIFGAKNSDIIVKNVVVSVARNQAWGLSVKGNEPTTSTADVTTATTKNWVLAIGWSSGQNVKSTNFYTTLEDNTSGATVISVDDIATLVKTNSNGFIIGVADSLGFMDKMYAQVSDVVEGKYIIRFVIPALKLTDVDNIKMNIEVEGASRGTLTKTIDCTLYDSLTGYEGRDGFTTYEPAQYNAEKFLAGAITDVPAGTAYTFKITATYTLDGIAVTSTTYAANVGTDGKLVNNSN